MNNEASLNIKLYNNDCMNILRDIKSDTVDLAIIDPPYKTICGGSNNGKNAKRPKGILSNNKKIFNYQNNIKISDWIFEIYRVLKNSSHCYIFTNSLNLKEMIEESERAGFKLHNVLVWEKNNCTPSQFYMKNCEYVLFLRKGRAKWINNIGSSKTVHKFNNIVGNKLHPTEKPVDLLSFYITNSSKEGDLILDPFMGSGSTGESCILNNRNFIGIEIDHKYFEIADNRLNNLLEQERVNNES